MRILIIPFLLFFCSFGAFAYDIQYEKSDSIKVVSLLNSARRQPEGTNIVIYFARQLKGVPYVAHTLEVNKDEQLIINLRQLDCTTYVENVTALTLCVKQKTYTFESFCANLRKIRYRGGCRSALHRTSALFHGLDRRQHKERSVPRGAVTQSSVLSRAEYKRVLHVNVSGQVQDAERPS